VFALESGNPKSVVITDEYGYQYNIEGKRVGKVQPR
jgi:hypothetical protein